jgi:hypothetical protein
MATADSISEITDSSAQPKVELLVLLAAMPPEQLERVLANLTDSFSPDSLLVASPDANSDALPADAYPALRLVAIPATSSSWTLTAADFVNAYQIAEKNEARAILMLSAESGSLSSAALRDLAHAVLDAPTDLAVACYDLPPYAGMVNSAILYPLTRALFASRVRFPMAVDLGLSLRMGQRLAGVGQRFVANSLSEMPLWPVSEAAVSVFTIDEFGFGTRALPQPAGPDLNTILPLVTGALFSDIEAKAAFWQRFRPSQPTRCGSQMQHVFCGDAAIDIAPMLQAFRLAYTNLREIWSLVLPPQSLLGLKRVAATDGVEFRIPDNLWARIVYDFLLAHRLRTINRGHLLGALIPLYLAWVASHINITASAADPESHIEAVAQAFEAERIYMVSRWRWPDRFNP